MKDIIKNQHEQIHSTIDDIKDVIIKRENSIHDTKESLLNLLEFLKNHFNAEEKLMDNDLEYKEHKEDHYQLIKFLSELVSKDNVEIESILFLEKWEKKHFNEFDKYLLDEI